MAPPPTRCDQKVIALLTKPWGTTTMRCDVLAVGTELLLGQIVDTNSAWLGEQLAAAGIDSLLQVKVGDNIAVNRGAAAPATRACRRGDRVRWPRPHPRRPDP